MHAWFPTIFSYKKRLITLRGILYTLLRIKKCVIIKKNKQNARLHIILHQQGKCGRGKVFIQHITQLECVIKVFFYNFNLLPLIFFDLMHMVTKTYRDCNVSFYKIFIILRYKWDRRHESAGLSAKQNVRFYGYFAIHGRKIR